MLGLLNTREEQEMEYEVQEEYMSEEEIREFLSEFRGSLPSFVLRELERALDGRKVTREQFSRIMDRVVATYLERNRAEKKIEEVERRVEEIDRGLRDEIDALWQEIRTVKEELKSLSRDIRLLFGFSEDLEEIVEKVLQEG